ncbi:hypothetical protein N5J43_00495 [Pseudomonas nicosulfuronedens]|uniref:Uncharacterized protein n=1 Tax=Pseudomonas nicosulfuronedens TaxID=2571105 RepID=A0A5R9R9W6_9PSED|nr:hypothetical protein [Pseudomonas nicosulfuronedens]MDH1007358.1 hypothetical protein [Pseudomonas nicosulfuronedens]MDH1977404.1 hypothetical protein [Pseudomonas nicosulfuronedens]MDH2029830.1 hypothetical protein [Pseudomonas nicosulfuronedens]TLX79841.1 hypothetical protein FAS41_06230 [Pseudomonas nicosulfuronedens]
MRKTLPGRFTALCLLVTSGLASAAPITTDDLVSWPRMNVADFACLLEQRTGHADAQFSCAASRKLSNWGDACHNTDLSYAGPQLPEALVRQLDPRIAAVDLDWEYGRLQSVNVTFSGIMTAEEVADIFPQVSLEDPTSRDNLSNASLQDCASDASCLYLEGFEHLGGGDVDCEDAQ